MKISPLKWVGSKSKILHHILPHIGRPNTFVEPFVGSATVSLNVNATKYIINDLNQDLIEFYKTIFKDHEKLIQDVTPYFKNITEEKYYELRNEFNSLPPDHFKRPVLFLFLNKFAFNGICRYNKKGMFNVPFAKVTSQNVPEHNIRQFASTFEDKPMMLFNKSFDNEILYDGLCKGDVVYFDPPYMISDKYTTGFTEYTKEGFTYDQHIKIKDIAISLRQKNVKCIISNHNTETTRDLYKDANTIIELTKGRYLSAQKNKRMKVEELLAIYY